MKLSPPVKLSVEHLNNPLGIDLRTPRFSWVVERDGRNFSQSAYQIIVTTEKNQKHGDVWDTNKIDSAKTTNIKYAGKTLQSSQRYYWRVRWWDNSGLASEFSDAAFFETGLLDDENWKAKWISKAQLTAFNANKNIISPERTEEIVHVFALYFRKEFSIAKPATSARIYVCGLGFYELSLNGKKIGDQVLAPAQTDYLKLATYNTFDITQLLKPENAIGAILGNGRNIPHYGFDQPKLILQLLINYKNGEQELIITDKTWKVSHGPITENGLYCGETWDSRLEQPGWDMPDFEEASWENSIEISGPKLKAQLMQPIQVTGSLKPKTMISPQSGMFVFDFGQNFTGWARLQINKSNETTVTLRHAELINEDGSINTQPNQNAAATDRYILKKEAEKTLQPKFTQHGFRYIEMTGFPGVPTLESIEGKIVHTNVQRVGSFFCSNELINQIHNNVLWGLKSNLMSMPTDCPQRDERLGDAQLAAEAAILNFDMAAFYSKFLDDIQLSQLENGSLPDVAPPYWRHLYPADPAWGTAYITIAWYLYFYYNETHILEKHYDFFKKYIDFLRKNADNSIQTKLGKYGDWCPPASIFPKKTPLALTSTWYYYFDVKLLAQIAAILEKKDDAGEYSELAFQIKNRFNEYFLNENQYAAIRVSSFDKRPNQTSNMLPLFLNMAPEEKKQAVLKNLITSVVREHDCHVDTGIIGTKYLLDVLTENGYADIAFKVATQKSYPGWGYMISEGATTLWERWEKITSAGMNSHNHIMLGSIDAWFYKYVGGLSCVESGWEKIRIKPMFYRDVNFASINFDSIRGKIHVSWQKTENAFNLTAHVPVGTTAEINLPLPWEQLKIFENGNFLGEKKFQQIDKYGFKYLKQENNFISLETGSGFYNFTIKNTA